MTREPADDPAKKLEALRKALAEGERSGDPRDFDIEEFIARKRKSTNRL